MNTIHEKLQEFDFCDGQIEGVELQNGNVVLVFKNWQERTFHLKFSGVVYFKSFMWGGDISEVQLIKDAEEIKEAFRFIEHDGGATKDYHNLVQLNFISEIPVVVLVFQKFQIDAPEVTP